MSVRKVRDAAVIMVAFLALLWILQVFNWADGYRLDTDFGILPHHVSRLPDIFTAPFLHISWQHIEGNSLPLFVLGFLAAYRGIARFLLVTFIAVVVSGLAVWLFQSNGLTVGASGIIFGYFGYVLLRGIFDRNLVDVVVGVVAGLLYWGILEVAIPGTPGVSWIGHVGGLAGGIVAAWVLRTPHSDRLTWRSQLAVPFRNSSSRASGDTDSVPATRVSADTTRRDTAPAASSAGGSKAAADLLRKLKEMGL
jgi:membrane associated rhomboid family serine protease